MSADDAGDVVDELARQIADDPAQDKRTQASQLVDLCHAHFDLGVADTGEAFGVRRSGPNVALQLRGGRTSLGAAIAALFFDQHERAPSAAARADALAVIEGLAWRLDPVELPVRVAAHDDGVLVDLGTADGRVASIRPGAVELLSRSPLTFRRTALTLPMPTPNLDADRASTLDALRAVLNVDEASFRLLVGWLLASLCQEMPHAVLALNGEQGTGKSSFARLVASLVDPTAAPLRSSPRDLDAWSISAAGSWCVVLDNVSRISEWLSDALCRAVTGDSLVRRMLYSDSDVSVLRFRRCVVLTTIDVGALRGDLAERMLPIRLERIDSTARRTEADVAAAFDAIHADVLGVLFDLLADVLDELPAVRLDEQPRMADFARLLAALDVVTDWSTFDDYSSVGSQLADDVIESDPVAAAVVQLMAKHSEWLGTASELLDVLTPNDQHELRRTTQSKHWPKDGARLSGQLKRLAPALLQVGIDATQERQAGKRLWRLRRVETTSIEASSASRASQASQDTASSDDAAVTLMTINQVGASSPDASAGAADDADDADDAVSAPLSQGRQVAW